jgi:hypothetical protein
MPPRRSDRPPPADADAGADAQMRKLESSLTSLRSAARERAAQHRRQAGGGIKVLPVSGGGWGAGPPDESEPLVAAPWAARFGFVNRAVARLRALGRKLLRTRLR